VNGTWADVASVGDTQQACTPTEGVGGLVLKYLRDAHHVCVKVWASQLALELPTGFTTCAAAGVEDGSWWPFRRRRRCVRNERNAAVHCGKFKHI